MFIMLKNYGGYGMYLIGEPVELRQSILSNLIGRKVEYLMQEDIDNANGGYVTPRDGEISEVKNHMIEFDYDREKISLYDIAEMIFVD